jgi:hypothetical protein
MVAGLYLSHGFVEAGTAGGDSFFSLSLAPYKPESVPIEFVQQERGRNAGLR